MPVAVCVCRNTSLRSGVRQCLHRAGQLHVRFDIRIAGTAVIEQILSVIGVVPAHRRTGDRGCAGQGGVLRPARVIFAT